MSSTLFAWIGNTDLRVSQDAATEALGPIGEPCQILDFSSVVLLSNYQDKETRRYRAWLEGKTDARVETEACPLSSPTHFGEIYEAAVRVVEKYRNAAKGEMEMTFHLSPGTPAMAAVWVILAKTRFPAELIESSREAGVRTASVPFDISADYLPDLLRKPDEELRRDSLEAPPPAPEFGDIICRSPEMRRVLERGRRVAPRNVPVLIEGESGTGKELLARAIHRASPRADAPFVAVNCGAIPSELVDAEFFGHEKGAFTGAVTAREGYLEAASGGTLFLDEIGELPLAAQVKLLRALQEEEVVRVGSTKRRKIDIRVIAATNRTLVEEVAEGRFREDLFHRIAVAVLNIPPLRERRGDLSLLVEKLLAQIDAESADQPGYEHKDLSPGARNVLLRHRWPGNVRELRNTLRRLLLWSQEKTISEVEARESLLVFPAGSRAGILDRPLEEGFRIEDVIDEVKRHYLFRALEETNGVKKRAAAMVGLNNATTLTNWMHSCGLEE